jgi:hypothetical protein
MMESHALVFGVIVFRSMLAPPPQLRTKGEMSAAIFPNDKYFQLSYKSNQ